MIARLVVLLATVLLALPVADASSPSTSYIFPAGAQRGTTVKVIVGGHYLHEKCPFELVGPGIKGSQELIRAERTIWFEGPRIPMPASQAGESYPKDQLGTITVSPDAHETVNQALAQTFTDFLIGPEAQTLIGDFTIDGQQLFEPAHPSAPTP